LNHNFLNKKFGLLDHKRDRFLLIIIILIFSIFFINVFKPWNIGRWYSDSEFVRFLRLSSYGLIVGLVLLFTQFPLRKIFKVERFSLKTYILWLIIEIAIISLVYIFLYGNPLGNFVNDFLFSLKYTLLGILIPYSFALLVIYYKKHLEQIEELQSRISKPTGKKLLAFKDDKNKIKFSVLTKDLLYIESTDNYVSVFYNLEGKLQRQLLRNTMKNLEEMLQGSPVIRCHRSFMVNSENVAFVKRNGKKIDLKIHIIDKSIPVSEKYLSPFLEFLS